MKLKWQKRDMFTAKPDMAKIMKNMLIEEIYEVYESEMFEGLKYYIIVADNGWYFKHSTSIAVNLFIIGKPMPVSHIYAEFINEYSSGSTYMSHLFCIKDKGELTRKIRYIKRNAVSLNA